MKRNVWITLLVGVLAALSLVVSVSLAQTGGGYDLTWNTIDNGAMFSSGSGYELGGTIGQPDVGFSFGSDYTLTGGFWAGAAVNYNVYLPLVRK